MHFIRCRISEHTTRCVLPVGIDKVQLVQGNSEAVRELIPKNVTPLPRYSDRSPETPKNFVAPTDVEKLHFRDISGPRPSCAWENPNFA